MVDFYAPYRRFAELAYQSDLQLVFKLELGGCIIFHNTPILHVRTAFESSGARHLQGCYADLDSLASRLVVLRRTIEG
jgi:gamma-butyrobetaine dioxygenase